MNEGQGRAEGGSRLLAALLVVLGNPRLLTRGVELLTLAITEFFLPQFETRLFPGARRVIRLHHPLDDSIPFVPSQVRTYLGFIRIWLEGLGQLSARLGEAAARPIAESIEDLCRVYRAAGRVYRRCQTTTSRPPGPACSLRFLLIRLVDPHLHCVPSLHVLIVCYNYLNLRRVLGKSRGGSEDTAAVQAYQAALRVIRAVLLVKQHSVADIGPSLYVLSELFPAYDRREARRFVGDVFGGLAGVSTDLRAALQRAVLADYRDVAVERKRYPSLSMEELVVGYLEDSSRSR